MTDGADRYGQETAWRIHAALIDWTGKVDVKAAFALTLESAALALTAALHSGAPLSSSGPPSGSSALLATGAVLLGAAALFAVLAVTPRMRVDRTARHPTPDFIYFGHVRALEPEELAQMLRSADPLPALSRQLVTMSRIAWYKHRCTQASLSLAAAGLVAVAVAGAVS
ncbi:Pycsar system effector family protein [Streptomyces sp. NPDC048389]|uniref:Pycsar system effector family protein n=1 Tax=Streptomyces sp. NPDC048389 TaxID=3154622 RepID=UPI00345496D8